MKLLKVTASCIRCKQVLDLNVLDQICPSCEASFDKFDPSEAKEILAKQIRETGEYILDLGNIKLKVLMPQRYFETEDPPAGEGVFITFAELEVTPFEATAKLRDLK